MSPLAKVFAFVLLLALPMSAANCAAENCGQDETSLLQVKKEVASGSDRLSEKDTVAQHKPPVRVEPPQAASKSRGHAAAQLHEEKATAEEIPRVAPKGTAALDSQFPGVFVPGGGSQVVSSVVPELGGGVVSGLGPTMVGQPILPGVGGGIYGGGLYGGGLVQDPALLGGGLYGGSLVQDPALVQGVGIGGVGVLGAPGIVGDPYTGGYGGVGMPSVIGATGFAGGMPGIGGYSTLGGYGPTVGMPVGGYGYGSPLAGAGMAIGGVGVTQVLQNGLPGQVIAGGQAPVAAARAVANTAASTAERAAAQASVADSTAKNAAAAVTALHHQAIHQAAHNIYPHQHVVSAGLTGSYQQGVRDGYQAAISHAQAAANTWAYPQVVTNGLGYGNGLGGYTSGEIATNDWAGYTPLAYGQPGYSYADLA